jgi:hypothetical protein
METKSFRVAGLPTCYHTEKTKEIFKRCVNGSVTEFVTSAIVEYAEELGFTYYDWGLDTRPDYISEKRFQEICYKIDRMRKTDYTYLVAFEYLIWKRPGVSKSNLQRDAILNFC